MIVVTGTKRSGTSMWMQILDAAGLEVIGDRFPLDWEERLGELNPQGFYESRLRGGINFTSNPDPMTGQYLAPREHKQHAIKIFAAGLVTTDLAYLDRVVATMREWRAYVASRDRLEAADMRQEVPEDVRFAGRYNVPAHLEWWLENYILLRDAMLRRYAFTFFSYESIVAGDRSLIDGTIDWLGCGDADAAFDAIEPREVGDPPDVDVDLPDDIIAAFDEFYDRVHHGKQLDQDFIDMLDDTHEQLLPQLTEHLQQSQAAVYRLAQARRRE